MSDYKPVLTGQEMGNIAAKYLLGIGPFGSLMPYARAIERAAIEKYQATCKETLQVDEAQP